MKFTTVACVVLVVAPVLCAPNFGLGSLFGNHRNSAVSPETETEPLLRNHQSPSVPAEEIPPVNNGQHQGPSRVKESTISHPPHESSHTTTETETTTTSSQVPWFTMPINPAVAPGVNVYALGPTLNAPHSSASSASKTASATSSDVISAVKRTVSPLAAATKLPAD